MNTSREIQAGSNLSFTELIFQQKEFFNTNKTKNLKFRREKLKLLLVVLKANEKKLYQAIYKDFRKSEFETFETELALIYHEIKLAIKKIPLWAKNKKVSTDLANLPGKSYIINEPLGNTLIIGAWNYPYQLSILPAVSSMAAGNTVIIKPSELSANTSKIMAEIINQAFDEKYLHVVEGGIEETTELLKLKFDKIFYTGSSQVGKIVMKAAAEKLCPVVLELGGKSPALVLKDANIKMAAKRLVYGKFLNAGQTCVAPDYILADKSIKQKIITEIKSQILSIHSDNPKNSEALVRIINKRHFNRIINLIDKNKVIIGGDFKEDELFISPTVIDNVSWDDEIMKDEIFGPLLPIIEFENINDVITKIKERPKPLALYLFTNSSSIRERIFSEISFGGGMLNDVITHLTNTKLPFGGVGNSGMGNYHGKYGFDVFSHHKSILQKSNLIELFVKYPPYSKFKMKIIKWALNA
jgi:aldehyde dehydrogenase (NAD+)